MGASQFAGRRDPLRDSPCGSPVAREETRPGQHPEYRRTQARGDGAAGERIALSRPREQRHVWDLLGHHGRQAAVRKSRPGANSRLRLRGGSAGGAQHEGFLRESIRSRRASGQIPQRRAAGIEGRLEAQGWKGDHCACQRAVGSRTGTKRSVLRSDGGRCDRPDRHREATARGAEIRSHRAAGRRHRARLQQHDRRHHRLGGYRRRRNGSRVAAPPPLRKSAPAG